MNIQQDFNELLQETVWSTTLDNGLHVFALVKPGFQKKYASFATHYGSIDSTFVVPGSSEPVKVPDGIAHFLEHKLFEEKAGDVFDRFASLGASANAFTTYTLTTYLFSATDAFPENLDILLDFVQDPYFTDANVEKEKGIIEQELRMYDEHPDHKVVVNLLQALYHNNPVRLEIGGTVESIHQINKELLYQCYETFYHPSNMALFVVGDFHPEQVMEQVAEDARGRQISPREAIQREYPQEPPGVKEHRVEDDLVVSRPKFLLGFKDARFGLYGEDLLRQEIATNFMWRVALGRSSALFNQLYDASLIDDDFFARYSGAIRYGHSMLGGETQDPDALYQRLTAGIEDLKEEGLPEDDFRRIRKQYIGNFLDAFNSLEFIATGFLSNFFRGANLLRYIDIVESLTLEDLNRRLVEHVSSDRMSVSIVKPKTGNP